MQYFGNITTVLFSKYASPIFTHRKPNGRLRPLVDLRKINNLISDNYININHPVSTLSDASQNLAGKKRTTLTAEELKINLRAVFQCVREAGLRLTMAMCQCGAKEVEFLGRTVSPERIALQTHIIQNYHRKLSFPKTKKDPKLHRVFELLQELHS